MATQASGTPAREPARKFSFLEDQKWQKDRDEAAAAAAAEDVYTPGYKEYLVLAYFCINIFLIGIPLINSNAIIKLWKNSEVFRSECSSLDDVSPWCAEQAESAKIALLLFQSALAATGLMGGVLVDTFSASMCLLISHILFAIGAYFFAEATTRGIFVGCFLQGISGELLLNSVVPMCGLFGSYQTGISLILTLFNNLSVLSIPLILRFIAPDSKLSSVQADFYAELNTYLKYYGIIAGVVGTFLLPIDDNGNLIPLSGAKASTLNSINRVPTGLLSSPIEQRFPSMSGSLDRHYSLDTGDIDDRSDLDDYDDTRLILQQTGEHEKTKRVKKLKSLWGLRFTRQLRTLQFFICIALFSICNLRNSFYLNNNQSLLEGAGDDGTLTEGFSWLLVLDAVFGPLSWRLNDNMPLMYTLGLFASLGLAVNILVAIDLRPLQWVTILFFIASRSFLSSTILTYIAGCFGFKHFPAMAVVIAIPGAFFNFLNLFVDQYTEKHFGGNYHYANYLFIGLGLIVFLLILLEFLFPTLKGEDSDASTNQSEKLKQAVNTLGEGRAITPARSRQQEAAMRRYQRRASTTLSAQDTIQDEDDAWEDSEHDEAFRSRL